MEKVFGAVLLEGRRPVMLVVVAWLCQGGPWAVLGLGPVGGGCEMGLFGHDSEKPSHVEGGLSAVGFAIRVD